MESYVTRGAGEKIVTYQIDDVVNGTSALYGEKFGYFGHPLQLQPITSATGPGVNTVGAYPNDGTGGLQAAAAGTATLATTGPDWNIAGFLLVLTSGTGVGQVRRVIAYNTGTKVATLDRNWGTTPSAADTYAVLIPTFGKSELVIKTEFSDVAANTGTCTLLPLFFDYPRNIPTSGTAAFLGHQGVEGSSPSLRAPIVAEGALLDVTNYDLTYLPAQSGYKKGQTRTDSCRGAIGAKVYLQSAPAGVTKVMLWAGAV